MKTYCPTRPREGLDRRSRPARAGRRGSPRRRRSACPPPTWRRRAPSSRSPVTTWTRPRTREALRPRFSTVTSWPGLDRVLDAGGADVPRAAEEQQPHAVTARGSPPSDSSVLKPESSNLHSGPSPRNFSPDAARVRPAGVDRLVRAAGIARGRGAPVAGAAAAARVRAELRSEPPPPVRARRWPRRRAGSLRRPPAISQSRRGTRGRPRSARRSG